MVHVIRTASGLDVDTICKLIHAAVKDMESKGIYQWDTVYPSRGHIESDLANGNLYTLVDHDRILGLVTLDTNEPIEYQSIGWSVDAPALVVHRLTVHPEHQNLGHASTLMSFAESLAINVGCNSIRLDAFTKNPAACAFYNRRGYRNLGTVEFRMGTFYCFEKVL